jgi:hypothetical protein
MRIINLNVLHDGQKWIAKNDEINVSGETLSDIDEKIRKRLKELLGKGKVKVTMELDFRKNIPHWIWQYHPYYFYRTIYIDLNRP